MEQYTTNDRLRELNGSGYEIADEQPDIINWTIKDQAGRRLGVVNDLLFDPELQKVRYIIAHLKDNDLSLEKRKVLIPIGVVELHETNDDVILPVVAAWQIRALPTYQRNRLYHSDEQDVLTVFSSTPTTDGTGSKAPREPEDFYAHQHFNHDNIYRKRMRDQSSSAASSQRSFRKRPGGPLHISDEPDSVYSDSDDYRTGTPDLKDTTLANREREYEESLASTDKRNSYMDPIVSKINRVQSELEELKRDITSGDRGNYL